MSPGEHSLTQRSQCGTRGEAAVATFSITRQKYRPEDAAALDPGVRQESPMTAVDSRRATRATPAPASFVAAHLVAHRRRALAELGYTKQLHRGLGSYAAFAGASRSSRSSRRCSRCSHWASARRPGVLLHLADRVRLPVLRLPGVRRAVGQVPRRRRRSTSGRDDWPARPSGGSRGGSCSSATSCPSRRWPSRCRASCVHLVGVPARRLRHRAHHRLGRDQRDHPRHHHHCAVHADQRDRGVLHGQGHRDRRPASRSSV